jgi:hypothetical protein
MKALNGVLLFTGIEIVTLAVWLALAPTHLLASLIVLAVGLFAEHYVSVNVGNGRPPFGSLPEDK